MHCDEIEKKPHPNFALVALSAVGVSMVFTIIHWWKLENTKIKKLKTLPALLIMFYPQYKAMRIINLWLKDDKSWKDEKLHLERDIANIGNYKIHT